MSQEFKNISKEEKEYISKALFNSLTYLKVIIFFSILVVSSIMVYTSFSEHFAALGPEGYVLSKEEIQKRIALADNDPERVQDGIHLGTGLKYDQNFAVVRGACTTCHSAKLIIQNRQNRDGWKNLIDWMQETQGLVDLGDSESPILDYLSEHYAPKETGRRPNLNLTEIEWYLFEKKS